MYLSKGWHNEKTFENIAEGAARKSNKEFMKFLYVTLSSIAELETQYILSKEIGLTGGSEKVEQIIERERMLAMGLIRHLKNK